MNVHMMMTFPMTCEQLHTYRETYMNVTRNAYVETVADFMTNCILTQARDGGTIKVAEFLLVKTAKDSVHSAVKVVYKNQRVCNHNYYDDIYTYEVENNEIISILKARFPDARFTQDPQKKYLFVDWS